MKCGFGHVCVCVCVCVCGTEREKERVIWTDILDTQFPDAENKHDSKNVGLFAFQTPDGACVRSLFIYLFFFSFFAHPFHFILDVHN